MLLNDSLTNIVASADPGDAEDVAIRQSIAIGLHERLFDRLADELLLTNIIASADPSDDEDIAIRESIAIGLRARLLDERRPVTLAGQAQGRARVVSSERHRAA